VVGWYLPNTARTLSQLYTYSYGTYLIQNIFPKNSQNCYFIKKKQLTKPGENLEVAGLILPDTSWEIFGPDSDRQGQVP
jgi:hypothetical protein